LIFVKLRHGHALSRRGEKWTPLPIFDFDDPQIWIETDLARQARFGARGIDPIFVMKTREGTLAIIAHALRCGSEERRTPIEAIDLNKNSAGFGRAATAQHGKSAFNLAAAQISRYPEVGSQARHDLMPRKVKLSDAVSCKGMDDVIAGRGIA
jgi:hypothetical protein